MRWLAITCTTCTSLLIARLINIPGVGSSCAEPLKLDCTLPCPPNSTHHVANISTAIQAADANAVLNAASARSLRQSLGLD